MSCQICCAEAAASLHFGVTSCSACAAFFRRTITLGRKYTCSRNKNCDVNQYIRNVCRQCRMQKCLQVGMDPSGVQPKRDPIRQANASAKRSAVELKSSREQSHSLVDERSSSSSLASHAKKSKTDSVEENCSTTSTSMKDKVWKQLATVSKMFSGNGHYDTSILAEISKAYKYLQEKRIKSYATIVVKGTYERATGRKFACDMDQAMKMKFNEFMLCAEFINAIGQFANLHSSTDKFDLFKQYAFVFECIDTCFRNRKSNWIETNHIELPDGTWMDLNKLKEFYMSGETMRMHADPDEAVRMFEPTMKQVKDELARPMHAIDIADEETFALMGLVLFDGYNTHVSLETRMQCHHIRNRLFRELMAYCMYRGGTEEGPVRFGTVVLLLTSANQLRCKARELFHMIKMFDLFDYPKMFDEVYP